MMLGGFISMGGDLPHLQHQFTDGFNLLPGANNLLTTWGKAASKLTQLAGMLD
jgi:hypothetical protein